MYIYAYTDTYIHTYVCIYILYTKYIYIHILGGILIFHDRYYDNEHIKDGDMFHPIRIKQEILDRFLGGFSILFNNCR
jgi:hypothetical protein